MNELYDMRFTFLIGAALLVLAGVIGSLVSKSVDWRFFSGIVFGSVISALNFGLLAYSSEKALLRKNGEKARISANLWYGARFAGMAAVYSVLFAFDLANIFTALLPLFFPRIHYFISVLINRADDQNG